METTTETKSTEHHHEPDMILSQEAQYDLQEAGKWAKFIAIMGFICSGLILMVAIFAGSIFGYLARFSPQPGPMAILAPIIGVIYFIIAIVTFYINYNLYLFATRAKNGITFINNEMVASGLGKLKFYFKIKGIILIIALALYALVIIVAIVASIGAAAMMHR